MHSKALGRQPCRSHTLQPAPCRRTCHYLLSLAWHCRFPRRRRAHRSGLRHIECDLWSRLRASISYDTGESKYKAQQSSGGGPASTRDGLAKYVIVLRSISLGLFRGRANLLQGHASSALEHLWARQHSARMPGCIDGVRRDSMVLFVLELAILRRYER